MTTAHGHQAHDKKPSAHDKTHPAEKTSDHPLDQPVSAQTAAKLCAYLHLTEGEAQSILDAPDVTAEQVHDALKVDIHSIAHTFNAATTAALSTDPKIEMTDAEKKGTVARAARVRVMSSACDKLLAGHDAGAAAVSVDAGALQQLVNEIVPDLRARARRNAAVKETYSALLAYQHARYPGHGAASHPAPVASAPAAGAGAAGAPVKGTPSAT